MLASMPARGTCAIARRPARTGVAVSGRRVGLRVRAYKDDNGKKPVEPEKESRNEQMIDRLKAKGISPGKARELLQAWASLGAKDPEEIRKLLVSRSKQPLRQIGTQCLLDLTAALGGFYTGGLIGQADFSGSTLVSFVAYFFACYYSIQVFFGGGAFLGILAASRRYDADGEAMAEAVLQLAGPGAANPVLGKAQVAINTLELLRTLEGIFATLREMSRDGRLERSTLQNLSAYLTLQRAEEVYGFEPEKYGLTEEEAAEIAGVFAQFDANDNGILEAGELSQLCIKLGTNLSEAELQAALKALDTGKTGKVRFNDWVAWWVGQGYSRPSSPDPRS